MSRDFRKARRWQQAHRVGDGEANGPLLKCGHRANGDPAISSPVQKWWCCGDYQRRTK